jgi:hypothetical protein
MTGEIVNTRLMTLSSHRARSIPITMPEPDDRTKPRSARRPSSTIELAKEIGNFITAPTATKRNVEQAEPDTYELVKGTRMSKEENYEDTEGLTMEWTVSKQGEGRYCYTTAVSK